MSIFHFTTPVTDEDIRKVHIGDVIYLTGEIVTGRDDVHHRVVVSGKEPPVDLKGKAIFHAGPIMKKISAEGEEDKYKVISVGPTTSMRMEKAEAEFLAATGTKIIIGKGGMGPKTTKGCVDNCAIHTIFPGGCRRRMRRDGRRRMARPRNARGNVEAQGRGIRSSRRLHRFIR